MKRKGVTQEEYDQIADEILNIYDSGPELCDRYTVVYNNFQQFMNGEAQYMFLGMNAFPFHPQGFGQHGECPNGDHLGKKISFFDLPTDCQIAVYQDCTVQM